MILLFTLAISVQAGFTINLDPEGNLADQSMLASQTATYGFNISDANVSSGFTCYLYTTENSSSGVGDFAEVLSTGNVANESNFNFSQRQNIAEVSGLAYLWAVNCTSSESESNWSASNYTFGVDVTDPVVTINEPSNGQWYNSNTSLLINLTAYRRIRTNSVKFHAFHLVNGKNFCYHKVIAEK